MPLRGPSGNMNCAQIHVSSDAGVPTYMDEFQYRLSFVADLRTKMKYLEIFSVLALYEACPGCQEDWVPVLVCGPSIISFLLY